MSDFSLVRSEMSDMELATTPSRIKGRRRKRAGPVTTARSAGSFGGYGTGVLKRKICAAEV